jgi:hypothetical protein
MIALSITKPGLILYSGVAMLHNLPVVLRCNTHFPSGDGEEDNRVLPAFLKLVNLFWIFDQSGAFDVLQNIDDAAGGLNFPNRSQSSLEVLQKRLQDVPIDWEASNDVQRADICVTRQWMCAVLWRISRLQNSDSEHVTSLSHPIQIAQEFLAVISKLPTAAIESHGPSIVSGTPSRLPVFVLETVVYWLDFFPVLLGILS